jgi:hypothetical protein
MQYNPNMSMVGYPSSYWVRDVYAEHEVLGDSVIICDPKGKLFAVPYAKAEAGYNFTAQPEWTEVMMTYVPTETPGLSAAQETEPVIEFDQAAEAVVGNLSESFNGGVMELLDDILGEADVTVTKSARDPLRVKVALIQPGFGNKKDAHYYPGAMLREFSKVFEGAMMYVTDHKAAEKSERTKVSRVEKILGFSDKGAPLAEVLIFDPDFAEKTRNRAKENALGTLECSILASGAVKAGKVDGKPAKIVESIESVQSVDWVSNAGAGGRAVNLMENDNNTEEAGGDVLEKTKLSVERVNELLAATNLPQAAREWVAESDYADEAEFSVMLAKATDRVKKLTGSGRPFTVLREGDAKENIVPTPEKLEELAQARWQNIKNHYGITN